MPFSSAVMVSFLLPRCWAASGDRRGLSIRKTNPLASSGIDGHEVAQQRIDLVVPLPAAEHAVMSHAGLHVMHPAVGPHPGAELLRCERLADRADVVLLALDRHQPEP